MDKQFKSVVLGGTFDHLHKGHKEFLRFAFSLSHEIIIGLTSDEYVGKLKVKSQNSEFIESYTERKKALEDFIREEKVLDKVKIEEINDVYGMTTSPEFNVDALVVVEKTLDGGAKINAKRKSLGLAPLKIIVGPSEKSEDGKAISSSRIRRGEIDRNGELFIDPQWKKDKLYISERLREEFKKPFGEFVEDNNLTSYTGFLITVGDVTTQKFNRLSLKQKISVIDFKVSREKMFVRVEELGFSGDEEIINVENPPGILSPHLFTAIIAAFKRKEGKRIIIQIDGEDDLAVLPLILAAPLGANIFYGQPNKGVVRIFVDEKIKEKTHNLVTAFNTRGS